MAKHYEVKMKSDKQIRQLIMDIGMWAVNNYDYVDTVGYGMLKQMGRWARAQLKYKQAYRRASPSEKERLTIRWCIATNEAIGDALIFLMNWCFIKDITLSIDEAKHHVDMNRKNKNMLIPVGLIMGSIGQIFIMQETVHGGDPIIRRPYAQRIFNNLAHLCHLMNRDVMDVLLNKWKVVGNLNWRKFLNDGFSK